jgi:hypothetical protein
MDGRLKIRQSSESTITAQFGTKSKFTQKWDLYWGHCNVMITTYGHLFDKKLDILLKKIVNILCEHMAVSGVKIANILGKRSTKS